MAPYGLIIVLRKTGEDGSRFPILNKTCRIGNGHDCDIRIQRERVMDEHCLIEVGKDSQVRIRNLTEDCRTLVDGIPLSMDWVDLKHMAKIVIADRSFRWEYLKGSMFYSENVSNQQSEECNAVHENDKLSGDKPVNTARKSLVPRQSKKAENCSSNDGPDLISFDSPHVVSDLKIQNRKSRSSMLDGIKVQALTKEEPISKTPNRRANIKPNETEVLKFLSSPISLGHEGESSLPQGKSQQPADVPPKVEISTRGVGSAVKDKGHASHLSCGETKRTESGTDVVVSDSILNIKFVRRRSSRGKSIGFGSYTPTIQNGNFGSSVVNTNSDCTGLETEKSRDSLNKTANLSLETSLLIESTPRVFRNTSTIIQNSNQQLDTKLRDPLHKNLKGRLNKTLASPSSSTLMPSSEKLSSSIKKLIGMKSNTAASVCTAENVSSENLGHSVKIVVVPPTPENNKKIDKNGGQKGTNLIKFSVRKKSITYVDSEEGSGQKSKLAEHFSDSPSKLVIESGNIESVEECERNENLSGFLNKEEDKKLGNSSFFTSESGKSTLCSRSMSSVNESAEMNNSVGLKLSNEQDASAVGIDIVSDVKGDWIVTEAEKSSRRESLRSRNSLNISNLNEQSSVFQGYELSDMSKTPLPSEEYASWLSQESKRTSVASNSDANLSSPIIQKNLRKSIHESSNLSYFESVKEAMKSPLSISLNSATPVHSRSKSIGSISMSKEKKLSPSIRRSNRKNIRSIGTPCFVASIYNRLKTPTTVDSKDFEVSAMGNNSNEYVTVRKRTCKMSTAQEIDSDVVDYLSDISTNNSCIENGEMDSLMNTSSLMLDQSDVSNSLAKLGEESQVKSSWTSTPAVSNSTRKKRVTFDYSLCSEDLIQLPQTPLKLEAALSGDVATPVSRSFRKQSKTEVTGNTRESLKRNVNLTETLSKKGVTPAPTISYLSPACGESVIESSYNSALDNTVTLMNTPSMLDKDTSIMSVRSLRSCKSSIGDTPTGNRTVSDSFLDISHKTPNTNTSFSVINGKGKVCGNSGKRSSVFAFGDHTSGTANAVNQREELEVKSTRKGRKSLNEELIAYSSPVSDAALNSHCLNNESVTTVNGQEWAITNEGTSSQRDSLRSRKSLNVSSANEQSSVFQDMTKTPIPSDEYASWLSQGSQRTSVASTNEGNPSSPTLQRSQRKSMQESCTPSNYKNEGVVMRTPIRIKTPVQSKRKSIGSISMSKEKLLSPSIRRSNRKSVQSIGTPCYVASIYNRLKTPTSVGSKGFEISDMEYNSNEYVTVRKKTYQMPTAQEIDSDVVDYLSDISTDNSCVENGEMDSLMQTFSHKLDQSDVSNSQANQGEESQVKSSWTSTPAVSNSTRKKQVTLGGSLCSADLGQLPQTPHKRFLSEDVTAPAAANLSKQGISEVTGNTRASKRNSSNIKPDGDSTPNRSAFNDADNVISNSIVLELNDSQMSMRSLRSCKSEVNNGSNSASSIGKRQNRSTSETRSSPSLISTSWIFRREAEVSMESHQKVDGEDLDLDLVEKKSNGRNSSVNASFNTKKVVGENVSPTSRNSRRSLGVNRNSVLDESIDSQLNNVHCVHASVEANTSIMSESGTFTSAVNVENEWDSQEEDVELGSGKRKSTSRKSLMHSSFKNTPLVSKVTRNSVNATPDYSESMKDLQKTPAVTVMSTDEEGVSVNITSEESQFPAPRRDSFYSARRRSSVMAEQEIVAPASGRSNRSLRVSRNSTNDTLEGSHTQNLKASSTFVQGNTPLASESGTFISALNSEHEYDSQDQGEKLNAIIESGKKKSTSRKSLNNSSLKITPDVRKVTRKSVNATPDSYGSISDLMKTPAVSAMPIHEEVTGDVTEEELHSLTPTRDSTLHAEKRSSIMGEQELEPLTSSMSRQSSKLRKNSNFNFSQSSQMKNGDDDSTSVKTNTSLLSESGTYASAVNSEEQLDYEEEQVELDTTIKSEKRKSTNRKSSMGSSLKITPLGRKATRKSVSATPDYSESLTDLMKTPAVPAIPTYEDITSDDTNEEPLSNTIRRDSYYFVKRRSSMCVEQELVASPFEITTTMKMKDVTDSQEEGAESDANIESGKRKSTRRKSSIGSSVKITPQISKATRKSVDATPDYYGSMKDLSKTPTVTAVHEEDNAGDDTNEELHSPTCRTNSSRSTKRRSIMNAKQEVVSSPLVFTNSINNEDELNSQEVDVESDTTFESGDMKSTRRKSSIASSVKITPQINKVAKKLVNATPDFSESMDLLKTPSVTAMPVREEVIADYTEDTLPFVTPSSDSSRSAKKRSSINSSVKITPRIRKVTRKSVSASPDYSESMKNLLKTPAATNMPIDEEDDASVVESPLTFTNSMHMEDEIESQEEGLESDVNIESGKSKTTRRKSYVGSSDKITPQIKKVTRKSVGAAPDYYESMEGLLKTLTATAVQVHEEDEGGDKNEELHSLTPKSNSSRSTKRRSIMNAEQEVVSSPLVFTNSINNEDELNSQEEGLESDAAIESGKRKSTRRKSSVGSSVKITPQISKVTRKSVNATPDYSESVNDLLKTPAVTNMAIQEEDGGDKNEELHSLTPKSNSSRSTKRRSIMNAEQEIVSSPLVFTNSFNNEDELNSQEEGLESDAAVVSGKRKFTRRKSSIGSFKITPQISKATRKSVKATPDYSESIKDLLRTPAITAMLSHVEEDAGDDNNDEFQSPKAMPDSSRSAKRRSSVASSVKIAPLTGKSISFTPDYSQSMKALLETPSVTTMPVHEEGDGSDYTDELLQSPTFASNSSRCAKRSSYLKAGQEVVESPLAFNHSINMETGIYSREEGVKSDASIESEKRKSVRRKSSVGSSVKITPQIGKVTRKSVSATPDYSDRMRDLLKTPSVTSMSVHEEENASDVTIDSPTGMPDSSCSANRRSSIDYSIKITPLMSKVVEMNVNATPDYSESMRYLLKTPAVTAVPLHEEEEDDASDVTNEELQTPTVTSNTSCPAKRRSSMNATQEEVTPGLACTKYVNMEDELDSQEEGVESDAINELGKRKSTRGITSMGSSVKMTPQIRKVTRKSVSATPDYSESMKDLLKTPAVTAMPVHEEEVIADYTEDTLLSPAPTNNSSRSAKKRYSINSSVKITPQIRKVTRQSFSATPDYSESMKDFLKKPAITSLRFHEKDDCGDVAVEDKSPSPAAVSSSSAKRRTSINSQKEVLKSSYELINYVDMEDELDSQEEGMESNVIIESGKRKSIRRKLSIGSSVKITPQISKLTRKSVSATPDYSEVMMELLKTPAVGVMPVHEEDDASDVMNQELQSPSTTTDSSRSSKKRSSTNAEQDVVSSPLAYTNSVKKEDELYYQNMALGLNSSNSSSKRKSRGSKSTIKIRDRIDGSLNELSRSDEMSPIDISSLITSPESFTNGTEEENTENCQKEYSARTENISLTTSEISPRNFVAGEVSEANLEVGVGNRKAKDRESYDGHENVKWMKRWLVPKSPASRYSDIQGIKMLFAHKSPQNSYSDVSGLEEMFASPKDCPSEVKSTVAASCLQGRIPTPYRNPVVMISKLSPENLQQSLKSDEIHLPLKSLRSKRSTKLQSNESSQRPTRRTKIAEVGDLSSEVSQSELRTLCAGKENKLKLKQSTGRKETKSAVVVEDLSNVNDECVSIPDTAADSVILKSNLRNIAGQRGLRKHVHFDAKSLKNATQKVEPINEDGPSVTRKSSTRVSERAVEDGKTNVLDDVTTSTKRLRASRVKENEKQSSAVERTSRRKKADPLDKGASSTSTDTDIISDKLRGGSKKKAEVEKDVEEKLEMESGVSLGRQTRRRRGTERADVTNSVSESKILDACSTDTWKGTNEKENVVEPSPEKYLPKKAAIVTEVKGRNLDEPAQRHTRRGKKVTEPDDTIAMGIKKNVEPSNKKSKSKSGTVKENSEDKNPEKEIVNEDVAVSGRKGRTAKNVAVKPMKQVANEEDKVLEKKGKHVEDAIIKQSKPAVKGDAAKEKKNEETAVEPENQEAKREEAKPEKKGKNNEGPSVKSKKRGEKVDPAQEKKRMSAEDTAVTTVERRTRRGNMVTMLSDNVSQVAKEHEMNKEGRKMKRKMIRVGDDEENEEATLEKHPRRAKKSDEKADNVESGKKRNVTSDVKKAAVNEPEYVSVAPKLNTRRTKVTSSIGVSSVKDSFPSSSENVQKLKAQEQKINATKEEPISKLERRSRHKKNVSSSSESSEKNSLLLPSEEVQKGKLTSQKQKINATKEEPISKLERPSRHKKNVSSSSESSEKDSLLLPSEEVQKGKLKSQEQKINATKEEPISKLQRPLRYKKNVSRKDEGKDALPETAAQSAKEDQNMKKPSKAVSVIKNQDEEEKIPRGRNLRNNKSTLSDASEMNEIQRPSRKRIATASPNKAPSVAEEKSQVSREKKEIGNSVLGKPAKRAKLSDNNEENVVVKKAPKRVLRKR